MLVMQETVNAVLMQVWGLELVNEEKLMVTGGTDTELKVWELTWREEGVKDKNLGCIGGYVILGFHVGGMRNFPELSLTCQYALSYLLP